MPNFATNAQKAKIQILRKKLPEHGDAWWREYVKPFQRDGRVSKLSYVEAHKLIAVLMKDTNTEPVHA